MSLREAAQQALEAYDAHEPLAVVMEALRTALSEPVQEPVAWTIWTHGPVRLFIDKGEAKMEFDRLCHAYPEQSRKLKPLYTHPRQRKPLTDEEIVNVLGSVRESLTGNAFLAFARAIERAHGIGGEA